VRLTLTNLLSKTGLARTQEAYDSAVTKLFAHLDKAESQLESSAAPQGPYYFGANITEADVRLYVTIARFDTVYVQHFKCNIRDIRSGYPAIHRWLRNLYWNVPAFKETTQFEHIKKHYMASHLMLNPLGIVSAGPVPDILKPDEEVRAVSNA
jgi:glutathionyl-hydroquinone reductase